MGGRVCGGVFLLMFLEWVSFSPLQFLEKGPDRPLHPPVLQTQWLMVPAFPILWGVQPQPQPSLGGPWRCRDHHGDCPPALCPQTLRLSPGTASPVKSLPAAGCCHGTALRFPVSFHPQPLQEPRFLASFGDLEAETHRGSAAIQLRAGLGQHWGELSSHMAKHCSPTPWGRRAGQQELLEASRASPPQDQKN